MYYVIFYIIFHSIVFVLYNKAVMLTLFALYLQATDRDSSRNGNNRIRYSILSDRTGLFAIDPITGKLNVSRPLLFTDGNENGR